MRRRGIRAELAADGSAVRLRGRYWGMSFLVAELGRWLGFYRKLSERRDGRYSAFYQPTVASLEAVAAQVETLQAQATDGRDSGALA